MSTTLNGRQTVVPRRRSTPKTQPTVEDRSPVEESPPEETPAEEDSDSPVLLRLPDLSSTVADRERDLYGSSVRDEKEPDTKADPTESRPKTRRERSMRLDFNPAEFWQSGKGKLIVSGTLLAGALLLFALLGPKNQESNNEAAPIDDWVETDDRELVAPSDELVGPIEPSTAPAEPDRLNLGAGQGELDYSKTGAGPSKAWRPEGNGPDTRLSDRRGQPNPIPTFRIPKTYSPPAETTAGPALNGQSRQPLSIDYYQSKLPGKKSAR